MQKVTLGQAKIPRPPSPWTSQGLVTPIFEGFRIGFNSLPLTLSQVDKTLSLLSWATADVKR